MPAGETCYRTRFVTGRDDVDHQSLIRTSVSFRNSAGGCRRLSVSSPYCRTRERGPNIHSPALFFRGGGAQLLPVVATPGSSGRRNRAAGDRRASRPSRFSSHAGALEGAVKRECPIFQGCVAARHDLGSPKRPSRFTDTTQPRLRVNEDRGEPLACCVTHLCRFGTRFGRACAANLGYAIPVNSNSPCGCLTPGRRVAASSPEFPLPEFADEPQFPLDSTAHGADRRRRAVDAAMDGYAGIGAGQWLDDTLTGKTTSPKASHTAVDVTDARNTIN
jgi:hypothetical protein